MPESAPAMDTAHAELSCIACRRLKRKCSKDLPTCALCQRVGRPCEYPSSPGSPDENYTGDRRMRTLYSSSPRQRLHRIRSARDHLTISESSSCHTLTKASRSDDFPAAWFLDSTAARSMEITIPSRLRWSEIEGVHVSLSKEESEETAQRYFRTIHEWLPVVSKMRIARLLDSAAYIDAATDATLFAAMYLLSHPPGQDDQMQQNMMYSSLKAGIAACERTGQFSTNFLAAQVLTAVYELSQGLFPAAYFTIGSCSRLCYVLGVHDKQATQLQTTIDTWTEMEERRRLWWTTLIIDRYTNCGFCHRPLAASTIHPNEILPADDDEWDKGELTVNYLLVMSIESQSTVAPFARTCQAAHLLGRVCQHANEHTQPPDYEYHQHEAYSINRAILALLDILQSEMLRANPERKHRHFPSIALCCSALIVMYDLHSCIEVPNIPLGGHNEGHHKGRRIELQQAALDGFKSLIVTIRDFGLEIQNTVNEYGTEVVSPFVLHSLYQAADTFAWYARETGAKHYLDGLASLKETLMILEARWKVGGPYLDLLRKRGVEIDPEPNRDLA